MSGRQPLAFGRHHTHRTHFRWARGVRRSSMSSRHSLIRRRMPKPTADPAENLIEVDPTGTLLHVWPDGGEGIAIDPSGDRVDVTAVDLGAVRAYALPAAR
jgi:hypothetical protein